jgi:hypothetical protein
MSLISKKHQSSRMPSICVVNDKCLPSRTTHVDMRCGKETQQHSCSNDHKMCVEPILGVLVGV